MKIVLCGITAVTLLTTGSASADLILTLTGTAGSAVVEYEATGSVTLTLTRNSQASSVGRYPDITSGSGNWNASTDNDLGDFLSDTMNTSLNDQLALTGGGISLKKNGIEFGVFDQIDLDGGSPGNTDDVELDPSGTVIYPGTLAGDIISWSGSGTFTLEDGETFDTLFTATGTFTDEIDGGFYVVNIVPEPSSLALLCLGSMLIARRRRES